MAKVTTEITKEWGELLEDLDVVGTLDDRLKDERCDVMCRTVIDTRSRSPFLFIATPH